MAEELHFDDPAAAAQDPSTDAEALRQLAYRYPELRPVVAAHPHAYRGLLDWLHQFNDPQVNAALEARDDYDGYIDSNGYLVMNGDVSGAVAGSSIRTSESGMYVLGQGGVNSYSQVERTTPYSAVVGSNAPVPKVGAREQVVAQVQRHSIMGGKAAQDPEATAVYPSASSGSSYPSASGTPARTQRDPSRSHPAHSPSRARPERPAQNQPGKGSPHPREPRTERSQRSLPTLGIPIHEPGQRHLKIREKTHNHRHRRLKEIIQLRLSEPRHHHDVAFRDQAILRAILQGSQVRLRARAGRIAGRNLAGQLAELLRRARNPAPLSAQLQNLRIRRIPEKRGIRR